MPITGVRSMPPRRIGDESGTGGTCGAGSAGCPLDLSSGASSISLLSLNTDGLSIRPTVLTTLFNNNGTPTANGPPTGINTTTGNAVAGAGACMTLSPMFYLVLDTTTCRLVLYIDPGTPCEQQIILKAACSVSPGTCPAFPDDTKWVPVPGFEEFSCSVDGSGNITVHFPDGSTRTLDAHGMPTSFISPGGTTGTEIRYGYTVTGSEKLLSNFEFYSGGTLTKRFDVAHQTVGAVKRVSSITEYGSTERLVFDYHATGSSFGAEGDVNTIKKERNIAGTWTNVATEHLRYYVSSGTGAFVRGVKSYLGPDAYQKMVADGFTTPQNTNDVDVDKYADRKYEYDSPAGSNRVTKVTTDGGNQVYTVAYTTTTAEAHNLWSLKSVMTTADGATKTVYSNYFGQDLLIDHQQTPRRTIHYIEYTSLRKVAKIHAPSSIDMSPSPVYSDAGNALAITIKPSSGLIREFAYFDRLETEKGRLQSESARNGSGGTPILIRQYDYDLFGSIVLPTTIEAYPIAGNTSIKNVTKFAYTFHALTSAISQRDTRLPPVDSSQNGYAALNTDNNGTVFNTNNAEEANTVREVFDIRGRLTDRYDTKAVRTTYTYFASGAVQTMTEDAGGALARTTTYTVDAQDRVTEELGPAHNINGQTVQRVKWTVYKDASREVHSAYGFKQGATYTLINPVMVQKMDAGGNLTDLIEVVKASTSGPLTGSENFANQADWVSWTKHLYDKVGGKYLGRRTATRVYFLIPGSGSGTVGTNFHETQFTYDSMGRQLKEIAPGGTIRKLEYEYRNKLVKISVGTSDANLVVVAEYEYDNNASGGNGNRTLEKQWIDASTSRNTVYGYDWRDRNTQVDGEVDYFVETVYDNLDRVEKTIRRDTTLGGTVLRTDVIKFDSRGQNYQQVAWDGAEGGISNSLTSNTWFDPRGRAIKQQAGGTLEFYKSAYDALGRLINDYRGFYNSVTGTDAPDALTNNLIFEQSNRTYDAADNRVIETLLLAYHTNATNGAIVAGTNARPLHTAYWYDALGRPTEVAQYGNQGNDSTAFSRPTSAPASSANVLVSKSQYNSAGQMFQSTGPSGKADRQIFDHAGRATQTIENYKTGASTNADEDVITDFVYNADGQISTMTARNSLTGDQTTRYVYGTDLAATPVVYRNDLLRAEIYPDSDDTTSLGNGADGVFDRVEYMQNRQGEVIQKKNQNGSVHTYDYDLLGRLEHDRVLTVGVGVDNAVRRISISYTKLGLPFQITSYSSATVGAGTVLNQIERTYFGFGQLANEYQALTGAKDGTTPWVGYSYDSTARGLRPLAVRYPNGRQAYPTYGATGSVADKINRIDAIKDDNGGVPGSVLAQYTYLGRGTIVSVNSPTPTLTLDLIGSGTAYAGFDRFLRVVDQRWKGPGGADLDRYQHGYDQASSRTFRDNLTTSLKDEYYTYDGLQRLKNFDRGDLNAGRTGITGTPVREEDWTLDRTGNWPGYVVKASGTTSLNQTRGHNPANEITSLAATVGTVWAAAAHDRNGNMTSLPKPASLGTALTCKYDAWNRLVEIKEGTTVLGAYKYDGLMRRIEKVAGGSTTRYYHSNQWQVLEERVDSTTLPRAQYVWGPRYVDDLIVRDRDSSAPFDGVLNERLYYLQDANWNVTALVSTSGVVQERYAYEPYGGLLVFNGSWGSISASAFANAFTYTGRQLDSESGIYQYRYRYYHAQLGRFVGRDPHTYEDGPSLYQYVESNPVSLVDPAGLRGVAVPTGPPVRPPIRPQIWSPRHPLRSPRRSSRPRKYPGRPNRPSMDPFGDPWSLDDPEVLIPPKHTPLPPGYPPGPGPNLEPAPGTEEWEDYAKRCNVEWRKKPKFDPFARFGPRPTLYENEPEGSLWDLPDPTEDRPALPPLPRDDRRRSRFRCTTKPRGNCPSQCQQRFIGYGETWEEAKDSAEALCQIAGCHTPGGNPFSCDCGHTTCIEIPNR